MNTDVVARLNVVRRWKPVRANARDLRGGRESRNREGDRPAVDTISIVNQEYFEKIKLREDESSTKPPSQSQTVPPRSDGRDSGRSEEGRQGIDGSGQGDSGEILGRGQEWRAAHPRGEGNDSGASTGDREGTSGGKASEAVKPGVAGLVLRQ